MYFSPTYNPSWSDNYALESCRGPRLLLLCAPLSQSASYPKHDSHPVWLSTTPALQPTGRRKGGHVPSFSGWNLGGCTYHFCSHSISQILVTWSHNHIQLKGGQEAQYHSGSPHPAKKHKFCYNEKEGGGRHWGQLAIIAMLS